MCATRPPTVDHSAFLINNLGVHSGATVAWAGYTPWAQTVAECRSEFVRTARSFWLIPELIPPLARDDIALLYCFCRHLDDAIDDEPDPERRRATLCAWREELSGRAPARPLIAAFVEGTSRNGVPLTCAHHLLDGLQSDLNRVRVGSDAELLRYAYRVSAAVGLMLAPLLGIRGGDAEQRVVDLGLALQLSNVLLGVADDAARDRVYLPASRLRQVELTAREVLTDPHDPRLRSVLDGLSQLADRYYRSAELGVARVPLRYRHGVVLLGRFYAQLGRRAASGRSAPAVPAGLPLRVKLGQLLRLAAAALRPHVMGLRLPPPHDPTLHRALEAQWPGVHRPRAT